MNYEKYMKRALELAAAAGDEVGDNPKVGCIIVKDGEIIGSGKHEFFGGPHAEINAVNSVENIEDIEGSTFFVSMEPCSHFGKTPPCADRIIELKPKKVVIACLDPNPEVRGRGIEKLLDAGIEVELGIGEAQTALINRKFFAEKHKHKIIRTALKAAISMDGKIATSTGESKWITGEESRKQVQYIRRDCDAILTGIGTVIADNPSMTYRLEETEAEHTPKRIILDSVLRIPADSNIICDGEAKTIIFTISDEEKSGGFEVIKSPSENGRVSIKYVLSKLERMGVKKLLVEAGREVSTAFLKSGLVDEFHIFIAPKIIGGGGKSLFGEIGSEKLSEAIEMKISEIRMTGEDIYVHGHSRRNRQGV